MCAYASNGIHPSSKCEQQIVCAHACVCVCVCLCVCECVRPCLHMGNGSQVAIGGRDLHTYLLTVISCHVKDYGIF